jgi:hypothetical protein
MSSEWTPDIAYGRERELGLRSVIYLDGVKQTRCCEVRVKYESFERPAFGELIVGVQRDGETYVSAIFHKPRLGEFERDGILVKFVCGKVFIELDGEGKKILAAIRAAEAQN